MALLFCDSFDHYQEADLIRKWDSVSGTGTGLLTTGGRRGGGAYRPTTGIAGGQDGTLRKNITPSSTIVMGFAFRLDVDSASNNNRIASFYAGTSLMASLNFRNTGPGAYCVCDASNTIVATAPDTIPLSAWVFIEMKVVVGDSGSIEVRVNGLPTISLTGVDTRNGSNNFIDNIRINAEAGVTISTVDRRFDDLYVLNGAGDRNNDFLGDISVVTVRPNAPGVHQDFVPSSGSDHVAMVNQTLLATGTYVESQDSGDKETFQMTDITDPLSVVGVQVVNAVRKTDAGASFASNILRSGAVEQIGAPFALSVTDQFLLSVHESNPDGGVPWTLSALNAAEAGIRITDSI